MTEITGDSIVARGPFEIATLKPPPQYLTIGPHVRISLDDGSIEYGDDYQPGDAARTFWEAMSSIYGAALAAVQRVQALHQRYRDVEAVGDNDSCAHCNQLTGHRVPWPCPTIQALEV